MRSCGDSSLDRESGRFLLLIYPDLVILHHHFLLFKFVSFYGHL